MPRLRPIVFDAALATAIFATGVVELVSTRPDGYPAGVLVELVACLLLVLRRRSPFLIGTLTPVAMLVMPYLGPQLDEPAVPILILAVSLYTLARWIEDLRGLAGIAVVSLMMLGDYVFHDSRSHNLSDVVFVASILLPPYVLGRLVRRLASQKELLEEREQLVTQEAVRAERDRIARELHDVIAHSVSAMVVQTAAAQDLVRADPDRAEAVLRAVADTGRKALVETGRLLHVIRDDADELGLSPAPGVAELDDLVGHFRAGGLEVDLDVDDALAPLPAGIDVSAYRIAEEALTNALRYGTGTATLQVHRTGGAVAIRARNPRAGHRGQVGSGLGLRGMAERVSLLGGTLTHGVDDGHFELTATLPVEVS